MPLDPDACYRALAAHDPRFDGRFYVGVSSTRIYCRPVCTVRMPRRENCRFFPSAAAAEVAGYRPCLRCRPELAPGHASVDASEQLARGAVSLIEDGVLDAGGIEHLAGRVGVTSRHLRRIFDAQYGVSPIEYAQTQRLLLAKRLLTDTSLPVTEIALASGFASVRRFNALFRARYRMAPGGSACTRKRASSGDAGLRARVPAALRLGRDARFPACSRDRRRRGGVGQRLCAQRFAHPPRRRLQRACRGAPRAARASAHDCRFAVACPRCSCGSGARKTCVRSHMRPRVVAAALGELASGEPGLRVPGTFDGFELAVRAIVGQQVSVRGARTILGRIAAAFGESLPRSARRDRAAFSDCLQTCATPPADLARIGMPLARARTIVTLATAVATGDIPCNRTATSSRRSRGCGHSAASAAGPRITSRCGRCAGPTRFSKAI